MNVDWYTRARNEFVKNKFAYYQGPGEYGRWDHYPGANYVRRANGMDVYCKHHIRLVGEGDYSYWEVIGTAPAPARTGGPTWCNQVVGIYSRHYCGQDLDAFEKKEYSANRIIQQLKAGLYNQGPVEWERVSLEHGLAYAADNRMVMIGVDIPGGIGHVAVLQPDGRITQAGLRTDVDMTIGQGFGNSLAPLVEYWACQINELDENEEND